MQFGVGLGEATHTQFPIATNGFQLYRSSPANHQPKIAACSTQFSGSKPQCIGND
jgi:hypothetical protein